MQRGILIITHGECNKGYVTAWLTVRSPIYAPNTSDAGRHENSGIVSLFKH
jgi:hypothetical protein